MSISTDSAVRVLTAFCFGNIWNSPYTAFRGNYGLKQLGARYMSGGVFVGNTKISQLPPGAFMVYSVPARMLFDRAKLTIDWVTPQEIVTNNRVLMSFYNSAGYMIPYSQVYVSAAPNRDYVLVAISVNGFVSTGIDTQDSIYMTMYSDEKRETDLGIQSFIIPPKSFSFDPTTTIAQTLAQINSLLVSHPTAIVYVNGYEVDTTVSGFALSPNSYIDVVYDDDIFGVYDVPLDSGSCNYLSTLYGQTRVLLHTPKSVNPQNYLITRDGVTVHIRDANSNRGVYYNRIGDNAIQQVTHNDLSIGDTEVLAIRDTLKATQYYARVRVRLKPVSHKLILDRSVIGDLYALPDADIVEFLTGHGSSELPFWTASFLEASDFISLMYATPTDTDQTVLDRYVSALGYFEVAAILTDNHQTDIWQGAGTLYRKPTLLTGAAVTPLIYADGQKVNGDDITVSDYDGIHLDVAVANPCGLVPGSRVDVMMLAGSEPVVTRATIAQGGSQVTLSSADVSIYQEVTLTTPVESLSGSRTVGYKSVSAGDQTFAIYQNAAGGYYASFAPEMYGATIVVVPNTFVTRRSTDVSAAVTAGKAITVSPIWAAVDGTIIPPMGYSAIELYLNGYRLVEDVDYRIVPLVSYTDSATVVGLDIAVCNQEFLDMSGGPNRVEVVLHTTPHVTRDIGYSVENVMARAGRPSVWDPKVSRLFVRGLLTYDPTDMGVYFQGTNVENGSPFVMSTLVNGDVQSLLSTYGSSTDGDRIVAVDNYLGRTTPVRPSPVVYTSQYKLYSPFLMQIAYDLSTGALKAVDDPSSGTFMAQFSEYAHLRSLDPIMNYGASRIDISACALSGTYKSLTISDYVGHKVMQKLIAYSLPNQSTNTVGVTQV